MRKNYLYGASNGGEEPDVLTMQIVIFEESG